MSYPNTWSAVDFVVKQRFQKLEERLQTLEQLENVADNSTPASKTSRQMHKSIVKLLSESKEANQNIDKLNKQNEEMRQALEQVHARLLKVEAWIADVDALPKPRFCNDDVFAKMKEIEKLVKSAGCRNASSGNQGEGIDDHDDFVVIEKRN